MTDVAVTGVAVTGVADIGSDPNPPVEGAMGRSTRRRLLVAAAVVMARDGIDVSLEAVAAEAGVTRMTLYRQIGTRDQLLVAVLLHQSERVAADTTDLLRNAALPFADRLVEAMVSVVVSVRASPVLRLYVERITPTQVEQLDPSGRFVGVFWDLLLPIFEDPGVQSLLRADPVHTLDWPLRQLLLQLSVGSVHTADEDRLRRELRLFFVPSVLRGSLDQPPE
jgi:AcrR family transcriptional regulator